MTARIIHSVPVEVDQDGIRRTRKLGVFETSVGDRDARVFSLIDHSFGDRFGGTPYDVSLFIPRDILNHVASEQGGWMDLGQPDHDTRVRVEDLEQAFKRLGLML